MLRKISLICPLALVLVSRAYAQSPEEVPRAQPPLTEAEVSQEEETENPAPAEDAAPKPSEPTEEGTAPGLAPEAEVVKTPVSPPEAKPSSPSEGSKAPERVAPPVPPAPEKKQQPSPAFSVKPSGYFQARAQRTSTEDRSDPEYNDPQAETSYGAAFSIPRAVVRLTGHAHTPALTYRVQANVGGLEFDLEDAYLNYRFAKHVEIRAGKHKRPFSRQFLTPLSNLQFASPSYVQEHFGATRDIGVLLHNDYLEGDGFEYALGVYQGRSQSVQYFRNYDGTSAHFDAEYIDRLPTNMEPAVAFRLGYGGGPEAYSEAALEGGDPVAGIGLSGLVDINANETNDSRAQAELDFIFKARGFSLSSGIFMEMRQTGPRFFKNREHGAGGIYLQGGYVIGGIFEPMLRFQGILAGEGPDPDSRAYSRTGSTLGFNLYFNRHAFKWSNEFTFARETEVQGQPEDLREKVTLALSQVQLAF